MVECVMIIIFVAEDASVWSMSVEKRVTAIGSMFRTAGGAECSGALERMASDGLAGAWGCGTGLGSAAFGELVSVVIRDLDSAYEAGAVSGEERSDKNADTTSGLMANAYWVLCGGCYPELPSEDLYSSLWSVAGHTCGA